MVPHNVQLSVGLVVFGNIPTLTACASFPMDIVFRIYDNCLASGIEAMFAFSMALLSKNETTLLSMKFDQLLGFLNQRIFEVYQVRLRFLAVLSSSRGAYVCHRQVGPVDPSQPQAEVRYRVDEFIQDAFALRITPFMLDNYAHEYEELIRARDAHKTEMESLKNQNQRLSAQVYVSLVVRPMHLAEQMSLFGTSRRKLEDSLAQLNTEHCQVLVRTLWSSGPSRVLMMTLERTRDVETATRRARGRAGAIQASVRSQWYPSALSLTSSQIRRSDAPKRGRVVVASHLPRQQTRQQQHQWVVGHRWLLIPPLDTTLPRVPPALHISSRPMLYWIHSSHVLGNYTTHVD